MEIKIPDYVSVLIERLYSSGFKAFAVGGCIRDSIMHREPNDWDITSSSTPDETAGLFCDYRLIEAGRKHGTIGVVSSGHVVEITTFRTESEYSDCRHPESVTFCNDIHDDLSRRDFTINALAYSPHDGLIDDYGGIDDINNKLIRAIGSADKRFNEDALRIMRCIRFSAVLGFEVEEETAQSVVRNARLLHNISSERIQVELTKLILSSKPSNILGKFSSIIFTVLPEFNGGDYFDKIHLIDTLPSELDLRLAFMFAISDGNADEALKRLRFDNKTVSSVSLLVKNHNVSIEADRAKIKQLCRCFGDESTEKIIALQEAVFGKSTVFTEARVLLKDIIKNDECRFISQLKINGFDLNSIGITGKQTGETLNLLLDDVINGKIANSREQLLQRAKETLI